MQPAPDDLVPASPTSVAAMTISPRSSGSRAGAPEHAARSTAKSSRLPSPDPGGDGGSPTQRGGQNGDIGSDCDDYLYLSDIEQMLDGTPRARATPAEEEHKTLGNEEWAAATSRAWGIVEAFRPQPEGDVARLLLELAAKAEAFDPSDYLVDGSWDVRALREDVQLQRAEAVDVPLQVPLEIESRVENVEEPLPRALPVEQAAQHDVRQLRVEDAESPVCSPQALEAIHVSAGRHAGA